MQKATRISSDNVKISGVRNYEIRDLRLDRNRKIFFFPIEIHEKMSRLLRIFAPFCSISTIDKKNFIRLSKLKHLGLTDNKIEKIGCDTINDLVNLQITNLGMVSELEEIDM